MAKLFPTISWANGGNVYEVNIRQYTKEGTFAAFQQHLPRLQEMGVEILWLMPVTPVSIDKRQGTLGSYYACSSYTDINPEFGSTHDFKQLVNEVHARGMKLIIDWVANHTGWDHHWTKEHADWYHKNEQGKFYDKNGWADVIDLDYSNTAMRKEMIRCMQYWVSDCDIDGFRCDMAHLVPLDFWMQARSACDEIKPLYWLAETDDTGYHDVFDSTYAWSWMHKSEQVFRGHAPFHEFIHETKRLLELPAGCSKLMFTSNHDENSWNGTEYEKYGDAAKALAVLSCTWPAMPLIYSGQELPNTKRLKFFDKDEIAWNDHPALSSFYKTLLQYRKQSPAIHYGNVEMMAGVTHDKIIAFTRQYEKQVILVILNLSSSEKLKVTLHHPGFRGIFTSLFSGLPYDFNQTMEFEPGAWGYLVYFNNP
jgi:glycosidase